MVGGVIHGVDYLTLATNKMIGKIVFIGVYV